MLAFSVSLLTTVTILLPKDASALSGSQFKAGRIIDDAVFFNGNAMTASQIQTFLNVKVPVCDTNGTQPYGGTTRKAYAASKGVSTPFICLKDYRMNTPSKAGESGLCSALTAKSNRTAAQIIDDVSRACGVSQKALIVLLQKEQSLITDDWPWPIQYNTATGYGCPDSGPNNSANCNSQYYGFFNQVYLAARQFKRYAADPTFFNHRPFANNFVRYNPNSGCGGSTVYIENQATAGLYNYTPYQPNSAALNNLYGTGNSCSAYGNRNFWRMFNDWFGTTYGSYIVRSANSSTVYLSSGGSKYPISNMATVNALYPLGKVSVVPQEYINGLTTQPGLKRLIKGSGASLYFFDAGIILQFTSCTMVAHYGMSCGDAAELTDAQIMAFTNGPSMPQAMTTTNGKLFHMQNGVRREVSRSNALATSGLSTTTVRLNESSISDLEYGTPIFEPYKVITERGTSNKYLTTADNKYRLTGSLRDLTFINTMGAGALDSQSVSKIETTAFNGFFSNGSVSYILTNGGKSQVLTPGDISLSYSLIDNDLISAIPTGESINTSTGFIKASTSSTVYRVSNRQKSPMASMQDIKLINPNYSITTIPEAYLSPLTTIRVQFGPTRLIKSSNSNAVFMIDGVSKKRSVSSFSIIKATGLSTQVLTVPKTIIDSYQTDSDGNTSHLVKCGEIFYIANGGSLRVANQEIKEAYGFTSNEFTIYDSPTCNVLKKSGNFSARYIKTATGKSIFYVTNGSKREFRSMAAYYAHRQSTAAPDIIEASLIGLIPIGPLL